MALSGCAYGTYVYTVKTVPAVEIPILCEVITALFLPHSDILDGDP